MDSIRLRIVAPIRGWWLRGCGFQSIWGEVHGGKEEGVDGSRSDVGKGGEGRSEGRGSNTKKKGARKACGKMDD